MYPTETEPDEDKTICNIMTSAHMTGYKMICQISRNLERA